MHITISAAEIGLALAREGPSELMVLLAVLADENEAEGGAIIEMVAGRYNGTFHHTKVAPFLRELADAIDLEAVGRGGADAA